MEEKEQTSELSGIELKMRKDISMNMNISMNIDKEHNFEGKLW